MRDDRRPVYEGCVKVSFGVQIDAIFKLRSVIQALKPQYPSKYETLSLASTNIN